MIARYYATANVRAPYVCVFGRLPARAGLTRSCLAGVLLLVRDATGDEAEAVRSSLTTANHLRWPSSLRMVCCEADALGVEFGRRLVQAMRNHRGTLQALAKARAQKAAAKCRKKERQRT